MADIRVVYDRFNVGEYGHQGGSHAPDGSFTGRNVMVWRNGLIGPRPGLKASATAPTGGVAISNVWRIPADGAANTADMMWVTTTGVVVKAVESTGAKTTLTGSITAPTRAPQIVHTGVGTYILTNFGDQSYAIDLVANTVTAIAGSVGGTTIGMYSDRVFIANGGTTGNFRRVFYSEPADYTNFPALNFFDITGNSGVAALVGQRDHLSIAAEDGSWWVFRGAGSTGSLRKVTAADWPTHGFNPHACTNLADDLIVMMTPLGDWPSTFDGTTLEHNYLPSPSGDVTLYGDTTGIRVLPGRRPGEACMIVPDGTNGALLWVNQGGTWTIHRYPTNISSVATASSTNQFLLCDKTTPTFYVAAFDLNRPAFIGDSRARPGDLSDTPLDAHFTMPEWWSPPGTEVRVKQVIVDFVKYTTGVTTNGFSVALTAFGLFQNDGTESPAAQAWSEAGASASTSGVRDRFVANFGSQGYGAGFQVSINSMVGVGIRTITVVLDNQPSSPRV
jgi:hypothetical protein